VHRDMTILKDSSHLDSKRFPAHIALIGADTSAFPVHFADSFIGATMRAYRTFGPEQLFNVRVRGLLIMKFRARKY
jgi:hypothetical protein